MRMVCFCWWNWCAYRGLSTFIIHPPIKTYDSHEVSDYCVPMGTPWKIPINIYPWLLVKVRVVAIKGGSGVVGGWRSPSPTPISNMFQHASGIPHDMSYTGIMVHILQHVDMVCFKTLSLLRMNWWKLLPWISTCRLSFVPVGMNWAVEYMARYWMENMSASLEAPGVSKKLQYHLDRDMHGLREVLDSTPPESPLSHYKSVVQNGNNVMIPVVMEVIKQEARTELVVKWSSNNLPSPTNIYNKCN